jgi:outer membrane lipoprotein carrier protein
MKRWLLPLCFLLFTPLPTMGSEQIGVDEVTQRLRDAREKTNDFSADLFQEKRLSLLKEKLVSRGKIRYKKPDHFFVEFFQPESSQMVFDGRTLLLYFKEEKVAERYHVQTNPMVEKYLLFSKDPFQEKLASWKIVEDREFVLVIEILPKVKEVLFAKTRVWVSKKDWMVVGMEMVERNGDTTLFRYSNMKINIGLKESDFQTQLPRDVKVTEVK